MKYSIDLKQFRKDNNITQEKMAAYFGKSQAFITQIETGKSKVPDDYIVKLLEDDSFNKSAITVKENDKDKDISEEYINVINRQLSLLEKKDEQIDRLLTIIENINKE